MADVDIPLATYGVATATDPYNKDPDIPLVYASTDPTIAPVLPPAPPSIPPSKKELTEADFQALRQQGFPRGLAQALSDDTKQHPIRFWIVDNSGSMGYNDGHTILNTAAKDNVRVVTCTRWAELQGSVTYHAQLAGLLQVNTNFRLLNDPGIAGPQVFAINKNGPHMIDTEVQTAQTVMHAAKPDGVTPLTQHLLIIREQITALAPTLRQAGQHAVIVLATDGLPTNEEGEQGDHIKKEFIHTLKSLQALPIWIVIRLCTDDSSVVDFYNNLDAQLELPLEVLDDFFGEAREIFQVNRWLNYCLPLHRCRELGYTNRIFDLLDERRLNKDELLEFLVLLFGKSTFDGAPNVHTDWSAFLRFLNGVLSKEEKQWNPVTKKNEPWVNTTFLSAAFGGGGFLCC